MSIPRQIWIRFQQAYPEGTFVRLSFLRQATSLPGPWHGLQRGGAVMWLHTKQEPVSMTVGNLCRDLVFDSAFLKPVGARVSSKGCGGGVFGATAQCKEDAGAQ